MKKQFLGLALVVACLTVMVYSCKKDIDTFLPISAYSYSGLDASGGTWKPVLLTSGDQISIPQPEDVNSASYQQELANLKTTTSNLSEDQRDVVEYWGVNSLVRWNEIASNMAAKYNLQPAPNDDGTYTAPDANNPSAYPPFPFANPCYASRMYAYWASTLR